MGIVLAVLAAVSYGGGDFTAGVAGRRYAAGPVTATVQAFGLVAAGMGVVLFPGSGPATRALAWGAVSGVGSAVGTLALYRGLSVARMSVVAACSAVLAAVIPAVVGVALGNRLSIGAWVGIVLAVPAIGLVSWQQPRDGAADGSGPARSGIGYGIVAGVGFALLFIALDRAGTSSGAWPLIPGQATSLLLVAVAVVTGGGPGGGSWRSAASFTVAAGLLGGAANLLFLAATGQGQLAEVAVLTALYPAVTVLLARLFLAEHWTRWQAVGLLTAGVAIALVSAG